MSLILQSRMPVLERLCWDSESAPLLNINSVKWHLQAHSTRLDLDRLHTEVAIGSEGYRRRWDPVQVSHDSDDDCC